MSSRQSHRAVWLVAEGSALACILLASAAPTGLTIVDACWRAAFGLTVSLAASRAGRSSLVWLAAVAVVAGSQSWWILFAVAALALAVVDVYRDAPHRLLGATVGGLSAVALLHLGPFWTFGAPSVVAAIAVVPVLVSGFRRARTATRRNLRLATWIGLVVVALATAAAAVGAYSVRVSGDRAIADARRGIALLRDGEQDAAIGALDDARRQFADTTGAIDGWWMWPASVLPVVGPNVNAVRTAVDSGRQVAESARVAVEAAPYGDLRLDNGRIDTGLIASMQQPVLGLRSAIGSTLDRLDDVSTGWLVGPVARPLESFRTELVDVDDDVDTAVMALASLPSLLGRAGTATYLVQFTSTAETRFLGGFMGSWAVLTVTDGQLHLGAADGVAPLNEKLTQRFRFIAPPDFVERYSRFHPDLFAQNWTVSPDLPTDASVARQLFEQATRTRIDGVLMIDPAGVAALLQLTGPVKVPGLTRPVDSSNVVRYLTFEQYTQFSAAANEVRRDQQEKVASAVFDALTTMQLPGYRRLADVLGPAVHGGHLALTVTDERDEAFLDRIGMTDRFPRAAGRDLLSLRGANANPNKIDSFLHRTVAADVVVDPSTGRVDTTVTITLTNDAPSTGLPAYIIDNDGKEPQGSNRMYLSLYSPSMIDGAQVDGVDVTTEVQREFDMHVFSLMVTVPSRSTVTLTVHLRGVVPSVRSTGTYALVVPVQPMVNADRLDVTVRSADPRRPVTSVDGVAVESGTGPASLTTSTSGVSEWEVGFGG